MLAQQRVCVGIFCSGSHSPEGIRARWKQVEGNQFLAFVVRRADQGEATQNKGSDPCRRVLPRI